MFNATNSNAIISKPKNIFWIFLCISGIYIKFWILSKKSWASQVISYWNYRLEKTELLKTQKTRIRILMDSQHIKGSETLLKSSPQYFCRILRSLSKKFSSKNSVLAVSEIFKLFVYLLTPDDELSLSVNASVSRNQFKCNYLQIEKYLLNFFLHFLNLYVILNSLKRKMNFRGDFFLKF